MFSSLLEKRHEAKGSVLCTAFSSGNGGCCGGNLMAEKRQLWGQTQRNKLYFKRQIATNFSAIVLRE